MNRFRMTVAALGVLVLIVCMSCASSRQNAELSSEPSSEPTAAAAEEAATDNGDSESPADAGAAFYAASGCSSCHGTTGGGAMQGPGIRGDKAADLLSFMNGSGMHSGGSVEGVTAADAENLEAFLGASP